MKLREGGMKGGWKQFCWMGKRWKVEAPGLSDDGALPTSQPSSHCEPCPFHFQFLSFSSLSLSFPSLPLLVPFLYLLHPDFSRVVLIVETDAIFPVCRNEIHRQD